MGWDNGQVKLFVKKARAEVGDFWNFVTPTIREAIIANYALGIVVGQHSLTLKTADIEKLRHDMMVEAGLWTPGKEPA